MDLLTKLKKYPKPDKVTWLFIFMFVMIVLSMAIASAELTTFDNVKSYDEKTKTATIENLFGLGKTYADVKLNTPIKNKVGVGYQKVAEFEVTSYEDYSQVIKGLDFYNVKKDMKEIIIDYDLKYLDYEMVTIQEYTIVKNETIITEKQEQKEKWVELKDFNFKKDKSYIVGIFTDVKHGDQVEWVPNLYGVKIQEWAEWTGDLGENAVYYWSLNETSGDLKDSVGDYSNMQFNMVTGSGQNSAGLLDQAVDFDGTGDYADTDYANPVMWDPVDENVSFSFWINADSLTGDEVVFARTDTSQNHQDWIEIDDGDVQMFYYRYDGNAVNNILVTNFSLSTDTWHHIVITRQYENDVWRFYQDGSQIHTVDEDMDGNRIFASDHGSAANNPFLLGAAKPSQGVEREFDGTIDEFGIWNITLTQQQITGLYNSGSGCTFGDDSCFSTPPTITLNNPANDTTQNSPTFNLNGTGSDDTTLQNISLIVDDVYVETNSSPINNTITNFEYTMSSATTEIWKLEACDDEDSCTNSSERYITYDNDLAVSLTSPVEALNSSSATISLVGSASDDTSLVNVSVYVDSVLNQTNSSGYNSTTYTFSVDFGDGDHDWYFEACDDYACSVTEIRNLTVDTTAPIVNDAQNITDLVVYSLPVNSTWNYTATDTNIDSCYWNSTEDASYNIETCNASITNTQWTTGGNKTIQYCANDTFGFETCKEAYVYVYSLNYTQTEDLDPVGEGVNVTFDLNVSLDSIPTTIANLRLNDTFYDYDSRTCTTDYCYFSKQVTIPDGYGNTTGFPQLWNWNFTVTGIDSNVTTTDTNVTVYELAVDDCSSYGEVILNMTLKDEEGNSEVNESLGSNIEIDLMLRSLANSSFTITYNNTWVNDSNVAVCIPSNILNNSQYQIDFDIGYDSTDRVWEFFFLDNGTLNSTKVFDGQTDYTLDLMDLLSADSTSFLFNYFDQDGLSVDDIIVHTFRKYIGEGLFREVERSQADENGDTILHLVEEDVIYYFLITQYGIPLYTSSTYSALCQTTPCNIQLEAGGDSAEFTTDYDLVEGGTYSITSDVSTRTVTMDYLLDESANVNVTVYKYDFDGDVEAVTSNASTGTSDELVLTVPLSAGNVSFFTAVYKDDEFINSEWVDFESDAQDTFGTVLALFLAILIILTFGLIAVSEGAGTIVFVILGVAVAGFLGLITTALSSGISIVLYLIIAGGILIWKLTGGRR